MSHRKNFAIIGLGWLLGACFSPIYEGDGKGAPLVPDAGVADAGLVVPQPECSASIKCEWGFACNDGRCEEDALFPWSVETIAEGIDGYPGALSILDGSPALTIKPISDESRFQVAIRRDEEWRFESIDSHQFFSQPASAVSPDGVLFVAQSDALGLYLHSRVEGAWTSEKLNDGEYAVAPSTSIAVDPAGTPRLCHIPFWKRQILYFEPDGAGGWTSDVVIESSGQCGIFVDRSGAVRIGFGGGTKWSIATRQADGSWSIESLELEEGHRFVGFAVRPDGVPVVAKVDARDALRPQLVVAWRSGEQWVSESVGRLEVSNSASGRLFPLVFDSQGEPYLLLFDEQKAVLNLVGRKAGEWAVERVMEGKPLLSFLLALDGADRPHIVFATSGQVFYARRR